MYKNVFWISLCFFMFTANVYAMEQEKKQQDKVSQKTADVSEAKRALQKLSDELGSGPKLLIQYDTDFDNTKENFESFFSHVCQTFKTGEKMNCINFIGVKNQKATPFNVIEKLTPFAKKFDLPILILLDKEPSCYAYNV